MIYGEETVTAGLSVAKGQLKINFGKENPELALAPEVLVSVLPQRSISVIFADKHINIVSDRSGQDLDLSGIKTASLYGQGERGREINLVAPVRTLG